ncbi:ninjurin-A-like isoform X3 [Anticarsia gemmatalis]|uniref:ninjurin-A-like isoform X3 n=1 Tax=Anticarsia gemmatalis TaxID=129554 RepID=UPI003F771FAC
MATDRTKLEIVNETNKDLKHSDDKHLGLDEEIELIFGKPVAMSGAPNNLNNERNHDRYFPNGNGLSDTDRPTQPLLEPHRDRQLPPLAGPEIDDLDGDPPKDAIPYPGIDDGLLEPSDDKPDISDHEGGEHDSGSGDDRHTITHDDGIGTDGPDDDNGFSPRFGVGDDRGLSPVPGIVPDVNTYQQKKNLAQGMMDLALLSANANQLRYVLESSTTHPYFYSSIIFISLSIIFQILVGVGLIMNSRYDVNNHKEICKADKINNMTVLGIFLITIVNVFITSFSVTSPVVGVAQLPQAQQPVILQANST